MTPKENSCLRWSELEGSLDITVPLLSFQSWAKGATRRGTDLVQGDSSSRASTGARPLGSQAWKSPCLASHVRAPEALSGLKELSRTGPDLF